MKLKLYSDFDYLNKFDCVWVYSDPHFDDSDCNLMDPNWPTPEKQIENINSKVYKNDCLILLGDAGNSEYIKQLRCKYKILLTGNHDKGISSYTEYFDKVYDGPVFINSKILLSHEPIKLDFGINIHGHTHDGIPFTYWAQDKKVDINVCSNVINYEPQRLDKLIEKYKTIDLHRKTINNASER